MRHSAYFTVPEAAWASDTDDKFVNREVDKKVVRISFDGKRLLARWDVLYLCAVRDVGASIKVELRRRIYHEVRSALENGNNRSVALGHFVLRLDSILTEISTRLSDIDAARAVVQINPKIKGGEPVIRGTRVPVRIFSEMVKNGAKVEELALEYELSTRQVDLALLYDRLYPRRGRPSQPARAEEFIDPENNNRTEIEDLGEYRGS